jgi:hypothetical protein
LLNFGLEQADRLLGRDLPVQLGLSRFDFFHSYVTGNKSKKQSLDGLAQEQG